MNLYFEKTINARKVCVVAKHLDAPVTFVHVNLGKGENGKPAFLALNPNGKVPVLEFDDGRTLWESNAIMAYLAREAGSELFPTDERQIELIRWLSWGAEHFHRHTSRIYFENLVKPMLGIGEPNQAIVTEANGFVRKFGAVLNDHLAGRRFLLGDTLTIADFAVGSALPYAEAARIPLEGFARIAHWADRLNALPAWRDPFPATQAAA